MRVKLSVLACVMAVTATLMGQSGSPNRGPIMHPFRAWGVLSQSDKLTFYTGFTNGYFITRPEYADFAMCVDKNISYDQAVAMVDKFYKASPEKWNIPVAEGILLALSVDDGPCPEKLTFK